MTKAAYWREVLAEVDQTGGCSHPIRLQGITLDRATGELVRGTILLACKDRRAAVCPSCSRLYQADAWHLISAGIRGGKGVSPDVVAHPQLFVTLTAPSFGPVHSRPRTPGENRPCRPRRSGGVCAHGVPMSCLMRHGHDDSAVGEPLCAQCFDYAGAVLWNAHVPRLWERTTLELYRAVARAGPGGDREGRQTLRLSYMKVVEFQRRGLVHVHCVLRADGRGGPDEDPPRWLDAQVLCDAVSAAVARAGVQVPTTAGSGLGRARWGAEHDARVLMPADEADSRAIAAYVAKYATKTADGTAWLAHPVRSATQLGRLELRPHIATIVKTAWRLGQRKELTALRLQSHAHTLGYTGQFSSKSLRFSTTFGALRAARVSFVKGEEADPPDYDGEWRYAGRGYDHPEANEVAALILETAVASPPTFPPTSTDTLTTTLTKP